MKTTVAKIVYSPCPPSSKDVIWGKTVNGKIEFQTFGNEGWKTVAKEDILKDIFQIKEEILEELEDYIEEVTSQADWNQNDSEAVDYILNKPAIKAGQGNNSIIEGDIDNNVADNYSHAEGYHTEASGQHSHAEGYETTASGFNSHTEGTLVTASGTSSHAEGTGTTASGSYSHAEGHETTAKNRSQHAFGEYNELDPSTALSWDRGTYIEIVGNGTDENVRSNARTLDWDGNETLAGNLTIGGIIRTNGQQILPQKQADWNQTTSTESDYIKNKPAIKAGQGAKSIIEGNGTSASGLFSHTEGSGTSASGNFSHAEGDGSTASGPTSHAEGGTTASASYSHAEGSGTTASGEKSHAEGSYTTASGMASHAEGTSTTTSGSYSHAEGLQTTAKNRSQHVFGEYNIADPSTNQATARGNYVEIVGNGANVNAKSNARTLDWSGNETLAGNLTIGGASGATLKVESGALKVSFDGGTTWLTVSAS